MIYSAKTSLPFLTLIFWITFVFQYSSESTAESCRHLGVVEIKIGSEHCGYLPSELKVSTASIACTLADQQEEVLQKEAREGSSTCTALDCRGELRRWQHTYTHVISQNCWAECGWAWVVDCESQPRPEGIEDDETIDSQESKLAEDEEPWTKSSQSRGREVDPTSR